MLVSWLQNKNCFSASAFGDRWQRVGWKEEEELHLGIYFGEIGSFTLANVPAHCAQLSLFLLFSALLHMIIFSFLSFSLSSSFIPWNQTDRAIGEERELFIFLLPDSKSLEGLYECAPSTKSHPEGGKNPPKLVPNMTLESWDSFCSTQSDSAFLEVSYVLVFVFARQRSLMIVFMLWWCNLFYRSQDGRDLYTSPMVLAKREEVSLLSKCLKRLTPWREVLEPKQGTNEQGWSPSITQERADVQLAWFQLLLLHCGLYSQVLSSLWWRRSVSI